MDAVIRWKTLAQRRIDSVEINTRYLDSGKALKWRHGSWTSGDRHLIVSFGDRATEDLFHGRNTRRVRSYPPPILRGAVQQLDMLNAARELEDMASPPGNRLEALKGDLKGFFSVRINQQWRLVFRWHRGEASEVRIVDYHRG